MREHWFGFFKGNVFFSYARCTGCGLLFCPRYFSSDALGRLYSEMPDNMSIVATDALEATQRGYFDVLKKHSSLAGHYLEIGPDTGLFTQFAAREGRFQKFWLFEPNLRVHEKLRATVGDLAANISTQMFGFDDAPEGKVEVAVAIHVLDHLLDPMASLRALRSRLAPGARVLFVTHDESSALAKLVGRRWPAYCLQHPHLFNPQSIAELLAKAGYRVLETQRTKNRFPVTFLLENGMWAMGLPHWKLPSLPRLQVSLKLGNIATVAEPMGMA